MSLKTITLHSSQWQTRAEPFAGISWTATIGNPTMLASIDSDKGVCANTSGVGQDSNSLDAMQFVTAAGALPVFESDARKGTLTVRCYMGTADGLNASPTVYAFDARNVGAASQMQPFATVNGAAGDYSHLSLLPNSINIFDAMATGNFRLSCVFPSRPPGGSASLSWDRAQVDLTYTYGPNTTPDAFNFQDKTGNAAALVLSDAIAITGIDVPQLVSITGDASAVFSVNGDAFSAVARNIAAGQTLQLRMTAPAVVGNKVTCTVQVETRTDAWNVTTGSDVPVTTLGPPANLVNQVPGSLAPNTGNFRWQPRGNTIPMPFSLAWTGLTNVQYSMDNGVTWNDAALPGMLPTGKNIDVQCTAPPGPAMTGSVTLTYSSLNTVDAPRTISTGALAFVYSVELSPVNAFEVSLSLSVSHWTPTPSGAGHHVSVDTLSQATGPQRATQRTFGDAGTQWRKADGTVMQWPPGAFLVGLDYGSKRTQAGGAGSCASLYYTRNPNGTTYTQQAGNDQVLSNQAIVYLNGKVSPGVIPTGGWTAAAIFAAIQNDTFALAHQINFSDSSGITPSVGIYDHRLMVFFQVAKPPEGMTWEA